MVDRSKGGGRMAAGIGEPRMLADVVLVRLATGGPATKVELAREFGPMLGAGARGAGARTALEASLAELHSARLIAETGAQVGTTPAGHKRALAWFGAKSTAPANWAKARDVHLVARALGAEDLPAGQLKTLARLDGLAGTIVARVFALKLKGHPSPQRLRAALALVALERAFGDQVTTDFDAKSGLSAKAGRLLAGQLLAKPRAMGTDARLIAALAAEAIGAAKPDLPALRLALLRRLIEGRAVAVPAPARKRRPAAETPVGKPAATPGTPKRPRAMVQHSPTTHESDNAPHARPASGPVAAIVAAPIGHTTAVTAVPPRRPDLVRFVTDVRAAALERANGWQGNRKAYICHVWQTIARRRPEWALTEIEFKAMLAAAHSAGRIVLANADLKDGATIKDVQDSALPFRNAVFHYVRVDD